MRLRPRFTLRALTIALSLFLLGAPHVVAAGPGKVHSVGRNPEQGSLLINFVLDKSGSMQVRSKKTIEAFNQFLADQKKQAEQSGTDTRFSLTLFDTTSTHVYSDVPIDSVQLLTGKTYTPGGSTALYDAIGSSIQLVDTMDSQPAHDIVVTQPHRIMFVILTDGLENSSVTWNQKQIFTRITAKRQAGWQFVFLGVDEDAYGASQGLGIPRASTMSYRTADSAQTMHALNAAASNWARGEATGISFGARARKAAIGGGNTRFGPCAQSPCPRLNGGSTLARHSGIMLPASHPASRSKVATIPGSSTAASATPGPSEFSNNWLIPAAIVTMLSLVAAVWLGRPRFLGFAPAVSTTRSD